MTTSNQLGAMMLTDEQIIDALTAAGVQWQSVRSLAHDRQIMTFGSTPAADIVAGVRALLSASKPAAPQGWKLVPFEPTSAMCDAAGESLYGHSRAKAQEWAKSEKFESCEQRGLDVFKAMLAAAPAAPAEKAQWGTAAIDSPEYIDEQQAQNERSRQLLDSIAASPAQSGKAVACPSCGGSQSTWKCNCDPIWPGYADSENFGIEADGDLVLVERGLLGAACAIIRRAKPESKVLTLLRAITFAPRAESSAVLDGERAAFEAWAFPDGLDLERHEDGYRYPVTNRAWRAWQARAASPQATAPVYFKRSEFRHVKPSGWVTFNIRAEDADAAERLLRGECVATQPATGGDQ